MRELFFFFLIAVSLKANAQNEFAATAFYNDFNKIQKDAMYGFPKYKGNKAHSISSGLFDKYRVKLLLPLADSGWIIIPVTGAPYAEYFFEPSRTKQGIDQRTANLREAILTAYGKALLTKTETSAVNDHIFSNTYFYTDSIDSTAILKLSILQEDKRKYYLILRIMGNIK